MMLHDKLAKLERKLCELETEMRKPDQPGTAPPPKLRRQKKVTFGLTPFGVELGTMRALQRPAIESKTATVDLLKAAKSRVVSLRKQYAQEEAACTGSMESIHQLSWLRNELAQAVLLVRNYESSAPK